MLSVLVPTPGGVRRLYKLPHCDAVSTVGELLTADRVVACGVDKVDRGYWAKHFLREQPTSNGGGDAVHRRRDSYKVGASHIATLCGSPRLGCRVSTRAHKHDVLSLCVQSPSPQPGVHRSSPTRRRLSNRSVQSFEYVVTLRCAAL